MIDLRKYGVYKYLKERFWHYTCKSHQKYKCFNNFGSLKFVELPVSTLKRRYGISQYVQAKILDELVLENKLIVKLGQGRKRYYSLVKTESEVRE